MYKSRKNLRLKNGLDALFAYCHFVTGNPFTSLALPQAIKIHSIHAQILGIHITRSPNPIIPEKAAMELSEYE